MEGRSNNDLPSRNFHILKRCKAHNIFTNILQFHKIGMLYFKGMETQ